MPGLRREVDHALESGDEFIVGPGAAVDLATDGPLPDGDEWKVLAHLEAVGGDSDEDPLASVRAEVSTLAATRVDENGRARLLVLDGGAHRLTWYVSKARRRTAPTIRVPDPGGDIEVIAAAGPQPVRRSFPMGEFLRRLNATD